MQASDELYGLMRVLGISRNQLKAYLTLVERGPLTASDIASYAKIPQTKVYSLLKSMVRLGLIYVDSEKRPEVFIARPPVEVFNILMAKLNDEVERIKGIVNTLQVIYETTTTRTSRARSETLVIIRGLKSTVDMAKEVLMRGVRGVDAAIPYEQLLGEMIPALVDASSRVDVRLLVTKRLVPMVINMPPRMVIRARDSMFGAGFIGDSVLLTVQYSGDYISIYSTQEYLIEIARTYFNTLWRDSEPIRH